MRDPWDSQGNEKMQFLFLFAFTVDILIRNENIGSKKHKIIKMFKKILHVD